jgi:hypothetical protein
MRYAPAHVGDHARPARQRTREPLMDAGIADKVGSAYWQLDLDINNEA